MADTSHRRVRPAMAGRPCRGTPLGPALPEVGGRRGRAADVPSWRCAAEARGAGWFGLKVSC